VNRFKAEFVVARAFIYTHMHIYVHIKNIIRKLSVEIVGILRLQRCSIKTKTKTLNWHQIDIGHHSNWRCYISVTRFNRRNKKK